jgi:hypothetical protein
VATKIQLCSQALTLIGAGPITTDIGPDARQVASNQLYDPCVSELLGLHRWHFATTAQQLTYVEVPLTHWASAHQVPAGTLNVNAVRVQDALIEFDRYDDQIHSDASASDVVMAELTRVVGETYWPEYFTACVRLKLAAAFATAVAKDDAMANVFEGRFIRQLGQARLLDSQGRTAGKMPVGRFATVVAGWGHGRGLRGQVD